MSAVLLALALPVQAQVTHYVDDGTCPLVGAGTMQNPYCSIQFAFEQAATGDEIRVLPGTYLECVNAFGRFVGNEERSVHIVAQDWLDSADNTTTVLDGTGNCNVLGDGSTVSIGGSDVRLEGFTVTGAGFSGVFAFGNAVVTNNLITGNTSTEGGGLFFYPAACYYGTIAATISNNEFRNNTSIFDAGNNTGGDGGGIYITARAPQAGVGCVGGDVAVTVDSNLITNNSADAYGGGLLAFTNADTTRSASIVITQNTIDNNNSSLGVVGYGGGAYVSTFGYGTETVQVSDNAIRGNSSLDDGGGLSAWVRTLALADHSVTVEDNTLTGNSAGLGGGGLDLFFEALDLPTPQSASLTVRDNVVSGNFADATGGAGILTTVLNERSSTPNLTVDISGNRVTGNTSAFFGGGLALVSVTDADPQQLSGRPAGALPADQVIDVTNNRITGNIADGGVGDESGGGVFVFLEAKGDATNVANIALNTIAGNTSLDANGAGGVHVESFTQIDTSIPAVEGFAAVSLNSSIVADNDAFGVGGPFPGNAGLLSAGGTANFQVDVDYNDFFANLTGSIDTSWIVPGTDNLFVDPQLDALTFVPAACSPTLDAGDPALPFVSEAAPNGGRVNQGHTGGTAASTPSLADASGDNRVDGTDVLRLSVAFGALSGQLRYDANADFDSSGQVDGNDLALLGMPRNFGDVCP